jgi:MFS family permease
MLSTGLVAIDSTIVATAVPSIVHDIGGFSSFPWLFSAYLLAQAVSVPIYGKLSDMAGRKPIILTGIGLFLLGSVLCGVAWSMPSLIAFRALQGLGAGSVLPVSITIAGDICWRDGCWSGPSTRTWNGPGTRWITRVLSCWPARWAC